MHTTRVYFISVLTSMLVALSPLHAQMRKGDISASASYSAHFYRGEFESGRAGDGGLFTLSYNTSNRFWIEGRIGFGSYLWQTNQTLVKRYSDYYGSGAAIGGLYPGSLSRIESQNSSSLTTFDLAFSYAILPNASVIPFVSAGFGLVSFSPKTSSDGAPLPNFQNGAYPSSVASIPLGVGVLIPVAEQLSLSARYDHRLVYSGYLDDYEVRGTNDGLSSVSIGLSYRFNDRAEQNNGRFWCEQCASRYDEFDCALCEAQNCEICRNKRVRTQEPDRPVADNRPPVVDQVQPAVEPEKPAAKQPEPSEDAKPRKKLTAEGIQFKVNSDVIDFRDPTTSARMNEMLEYLTQDCDDLEVLIEGHASVDGPAKRNKELSSMRARAVSKWLTENGVPPQRIKGTVGYGSSMPRIPDPPAAAMRKMTKQQLEAIREQNRRIELSILKDCE